MNPKLNTSYKKIKGRTQNFYNQRNSKT